MAYHAETDPLWLEAKALAERPRRSTDADATPVTADDLLKPMLDRTIGPYARAQDELASAQARLKRCEREAADTKHALTLAMSLVKRG